MFTWKTLDRHEVDNERFVLCCLRQKCPKKSWFFCNVNFLCCYQSRLRSKKVRCFKLILIKFICWTNNHFYGLVWGKYYKSEKGSLDFKEDRKFILSTPKLSPSLILLRKFALLSQLKIVIGSDTSLVLRLVKI